MGMYTELTFNVALRKEIPTNVIEVLHIMLNHSGRDMFRSALPNHPLFDTDRWWCMLTSDSYYFNADTHSTLRYDENASCYYLNVQCNLKNYTEEIQKFLRWIHPHIDAIDGDFLGHMRYEAEKDPTLIYYSKEGIMFKNVC